MKRCCLLCWRGMVLSLAACGDPGSTSGQAPGSAGSSTQVTEVTGLTEPIAETPALITSAGQSADASMLSAILEKAGFSCDIETSIGADSFDTSAYKTLIIGVGGSQKGLGAAGVDADVEQERVDAVVAKAEEADMTIIVAHIGGSARRGELSDGFISAVSPKADYLLVVAGGDMMDFLPRLHQKMESPWIPLKHWRMWVLCSQRHSNNCEVAASAPSVEQEGVVICLNC